MDVKTAAGAVAVGLRHERGHEAMLTSQTAHDLLEQHRIVGGLERIGNVHKVDLELAGTILRDRQSAGMSCAAQAL